MCKACRTPYEKQYEGGRLILTRRTCPCSNCEETEFRDDGTRCVRCNCLLPVIVIGVNDQEGFDDVWTDPITHRPVEL